MSFGNKFNRVLKKRLDFYRATRITLSDLDPRLPEGVREERYWDRIAKYDPNMLTDNRVVDAIINLATYELIIESGKALISAPCRLVRLLTHTDF